MQGVTGCRERALGSRNKGLSYDIRQYMSYKVVGCALMNHIKMLEKVNAGPRDHPGGSGDVANKKEVRDLCRAAVLLRFGY
jgi:hypothetical protein